MSEVRMRDVMEKVNLTTRGAGDGFVVTLQVPTFTPPAEVIHWGARVFVFRGADLRDRGVPLTYQEALEWWDPESTGVTPQEMAITLDRQYRAILQQMVNILNGTISVGELTTPAAVVRDIALAALGTGG